MATFYKGAGIGTHWHVHDSRRVGFTARSPATYPETKVLIEHIATGTDNSPYISLTRSYAVAWDYAMNGTEIPTSTNPGYVYEIEIDIPLPSDLRILDPIKEVALSLPMADSESEYPFYQHNGLTNFLLGVVSPSDMLHFQIGRELQPPGPGVPCAPNLTSQLEALVKALRDAEILACGHIPAHCVKNRFDVEFSGMDLHFSEEGLQ